MQLKAEQMRLYALMPEDARCFVRVCDDDSALWVSDLPRKRADCTKTAERLAAEGFSMRVDDKTKLCYLDWSWERWRQMLQRLPGECPPLPVDQTYHEAYALCRFWLIHANEWTPEQLPVIRRVMKLAVQPSACMLRAVRSLHEEAAANLREGRQMPSAAGCVLAAWLNENAYGKETKP